MGKRRSTFGRRRSRSLGALPINEVCRTIDQSLPPAERLHLLTQYALETSISRCTQEILDDINDDNDEFTKQISHIQVAIESEIEDQNLYNLAMSKNEIQEEKKQWDQLKAKHRQEMEKEMNLKRITFDGPVNDEKWNLPDYSNIYEDLSHTDLNISYQVSLLKFTQDRIKKCAMLTETSVATLNSKIESHFENMCTDSPQNLIKSCF